ncbi:MAG: hypothetical protein ACOCRK_04555 [bacterium]
MGFRVKKVTVDVPVSNNYNQVDDASKSLVSEFFHQWSFYFEKHYDTLHDTDGKLGYNTISKAMLEFDIEEQVSGMRLKYKKVTTDGPIVGLLGYYIDLESGYIVMGENKTKEFIPLFNYYKYLNEKFNINIDRDLMKSLVEQFKIGEKNLLEIVDELNNANNEYKGKSVTGAYLTSAIDADKNSGMEFINKYKEEFQVKHLIAPFRWISEFFDSMEFKVFSISLSDNEELFKKNEVNHLTGISRVDGGAAIEFYNFFKGHRRNYKKLVGIYDSIEDSKKSSLEKESYLRNLSAMVHVDSSQLYVYPSQINDLLSINKSDSVLLNMYDIVDANEEDDALVEMDDVINTSNSAVDKKMIHSVIDKIGIKEYLSGASLAHVSKRFKYGKSKDLKRYINKITADAYELTYGDKDINNGIESSTIGFRKNLRLVKKALNMASTTIR